MNWFWHRDTKTENNSVSHTLRYKNYNIYSKGKIYSYTLMIMIRTDYLKSVSYLDINIRFFGFTNYDFDYKLQVAIFY